MYNRKLWFGMVFSLLALALLVPADSLAVTNASLNGSYGVLFTSAAGSTPFNAVGVLHFDGVSNVTASLQTNTDGTLASITGSGTYAVNSNGTGSMSLVLSTGPTVGFSLALQSGGKQVQMIESSVSGQTSADEITGTAISQASTLPFTNASLKGRYGLLMAKIPLDQNNGGPADMVGVLTFDGLGNIKSGRVEMDFNGTVSVLTATGSYAVNGDGSGTATLVVSDGSTQNFALALNSLGKGFQLIFLVSSNGNRHDVIGGSASR